MAGITGIDVKGDPPQRKGFSRRDDYYCVRLDKLTVEAMREGASILFPKPFKLDHIVLVVQKAIEQQKPGEK